VQVEPLFFFVIWIGVGLIAGALTRSKSGLPRHRMAASAALGPLAIPLAFKGPPRFESRGRWSRLSSGDRDSGRVDLLIGVDEVALLPPLLDTALDLWGEDMGRFGIATLPHVAGEAVSADDTLNSMLAAGEAPPYVPLKAETLLIEGDPPLALARCARDNGYNLVVIPGPPNETFDPPRLATYLREDPVSLFVLAGDLQVLVGPHG
jgi:hypothetical protein